MFGMGRIARAWSVLAVAILLLASAGPVYDSAPGAVAAPATGADQPASADGDASAAAKAEKKNKKSKKQKKKERKKKKRQQRKKNQGKNVKDPGGNQTPPTQTPPPGTGAEACQRIMVPAYFEPQGYWDEINRTAPTTGLVILNPNSGPDKPDPTWKARTKAAQEAGIEVVGYVLTRLGERPKKDVKADIDHYFEWFGVDGIYLDETSSDEEDVAYYREMANYARSVKPNAVIAVNPGFTPPEAFMEFADYIETYEFDYKKYKTQTFPAWTKKYSADRFIHVVHSVPGPEAARTVLELARERNAGYVFITDVEDPAIIYKSLGGNLWDEQVKGVCA